MSSIASHSNALRETIRDRAQQEPKFRQLAEATSLPANSLMRMFGPNGNPSAKNLFGVLAHLQARFPGTFSRHVFQARQGVNFELRPRRA
jgi:hypothetical protein